MVAANNAIYNTVGASISGVTNTLTVTNPSNTASSAARTRVVVGGASSGDPTLNFSTTATNWEMGIDNSVSDNLTISQGTALGTNDVWRMTTAGQRTMPLQSSFCAFLSANVVNATGNGTVVTVICDSVLVNQNSNYNSVTGIYTAPVTGVYLFHCGISVANLGAAHTTYTININTTPADPRITECNPFAVQGINNGICAMSGAVLIPLTAGDTAFAETVVRGGAQTVTIAGSSSLTYFSGGLFC